MPAKATVEVTVAGNLSADGAFDAPRAQVLTSSLAYTTSSAAADLTTEIDQLDQYTGTLTSGTIDISGCDAGGTPFSDSLSINGSTTIGDLIDYLNTSVLTDSTASLLNGRIRVTDNASGYSKSDMALSYTGDGTLTTPPYFEMSTVGGEEAKSINITVYDTQGGKHVLSGAFVRTDTTNTWDMVLTSITGDINQITMPNRRIEGITFNASDASYAGITSSDSAEFVVTF